jgi:hypothetical protein
VRRAAGTAKGHPPVEHILIALRERSPDVVMPPQVKPMPAGRMDTTVLDQLL